MPIALLTIAALEGNGERTRPRHPRGFTPFRQPQPAGVRRRRIRFFVCRLSPYNLFFPALLTAAHRLRAIADNRARAAALTFLLPFAFALPAKLEFRFTLAQRALWAAAILALPAALIVFLLVAVRGADAMPGVLRMPFNRRSRSSILSFMLMTCFSCRTDRSDAEFVVIVFVRGFGQSTPDPLNGGRSLN